MAEEKNVTIVRKKKVVGGHGGHHGGAWKVAYADFVTAMMAFFLVMWLMGADEEVKEAVSAYFKDPSIARDGQNKAGSFSGGTTNSKETGANGRFEEKDLSQPSYAAPVKLEEYAILKDLNTFYEGSAFTAVTEGDHVQYTLNPRIYFSPGEINVQSTPESRSLLLRLIDIFKQHDGTIIVEGYSDSEQDWALAFGRAMAVKNFFEAAGVKGDKIIPIAGHTKNEETGRVEKTGLRDIGSVKFILRRHR